MRNTFRPEFLNRIDDIILFDALTREEMHEIVEIQLDRLEELVAEQDFTLTLTPAAKKWLANKGYDPDYGARPLKRVIQAEVQNELAKLFLEDRFEPGAIVEVDHEEGADELTFREADELAAE
jgi:ATP-dependent Clp protease ATP-binding subunit ClpB